MRGREGKWKLEALSDPRSGWLRRAEEAVDGTDECNTFINSSSDAPLRDAFVC